MTFAIEWLALHIFGVLVAFALLVIVFRKEDTNYKGELILTIACCLVTLVAKSIYIAGGQKETLIVIGKMEYLGKCFGNYCALMFIMRWRNIKIPQWFIHTLLAVNVGFYILIATVDYHHLYYKDYWLSPSKAILSGYTLEISAAPMYYVYMAFLLAEIVTSISIIISSYCSQRSMPNKGKIHFLMVAAMLSPMILLSLRLLGILKGDDPTPLGILLSCIFLSIAVVRYGLFDPVKNAKNYIIDNLNEAFVVTDADHHFLFLNPMAENFVTDIKESGSYCGDGEIYEFLKGSQGFFDWNNRHYQVEETALKTDDYIQGYMLTVVDITKIMEQNRLMKELDKNLALRVRKSEEDGKWIVSGRGVLHLSVLIETMRREGYELQVGQPQVIFKEIDGVKCEPIEELTINVPEEYSSKIIDMVTRRKGEMVKMENTGERINLEFDMPSRGIIGLRTNVLTASAGEAIMAHRFKEYQPHKGEIERRTNGSMIAMESGTAFAYAIDKLQDRGKFFIFPQDEVYAGQVVGEHSHDNDLVINVTKSKKLTNMRASGSDDKVRLIPPVQFSLEEALEYIKEDEYVEVTPKAMRMRKVILDEIERKRANKS